MPSSREQNDLTLSNLDRKRLELMCVHLGLRPIGTNAFLRFQLRNRIRRLRNDDRMIVFEGVNSLADDELQTACADRGMRTDLSRDEMQRQLAQWLELSQNQHVPMTLLLLANGPTEAPEQTVDSSEAAGTQARAEPAPTLAEATAAKAAQEMAHTAMASEGAVHAAPASPSADATDQQVVDLTEVQTALRGLSPDVVAAIIEQAQSMSKDNAEKTLDERVADLERERQRVAEEQEAAREAERYAQESEVATAATAESDALPLDDPARAPETLSVAEVEVDGTPTRDDDLDALHDVVEAADVLSGECAVESEKQVVTELEAEHSCDESIAEAAKSDRAIGALGERVERMIAELKLEVDKVDSQIGKGMHVIDMDGDGIIHVEELEAAVEHLKGKPVKSAPRVPTPAFGCPAPRCTWWLMPVVLCLCAPRRQWTEILKMVDPDRDGRIKKAELRRVVKDLEAAAMADDDDDEDDGGDVDSERKSKATSTADGPHR